jgi:predicted CXXCH cytochrome family protein
MKNIFSNRKFGRSNLRWHSLILIILLIYQSGCSSTYRIKALSFFFDGVPNPDKETAIHPKDSLNRIDTAGNKQNLMSKIFPQMYFHSPYKDQKCSICHDQTRFGKFTKNQPELCYQCHDNFGNKYKVLHGPVGGGQCVMCHSPHQSINVNLLTRTGQSLCLYCHNSERILAMDQHQDIKDASCIECHNPHGGDDKFILR